MSIKTPPIKIKITIQLNAGYSIAAKIKEVKK
jgi:hypothetical protein